MSVEASRSPVEATRRPAAACSSTSRKQRCRLRRRWPWAAAPFRGSLTMTWSLIGRSVDRRVASPLMSPCRRPETSGHQSLRDVGMLRPFPPSEAPSCSSWPRSPSADGDVAAPSMFHCSPEIHQRWSLPGTRSSDRSEATIGDVGRDRGVVQVERVPDPSEAATVEWTDLLHRKPWASSQPRSNQVRRGSR